MAVSATPPTTTDNKLTQAEKKARRQHLKTTKNRPTDVEEGWTPFRAAEKKYKAKWPIPDLTGVLDFGEGFEQSDDGIGTHGSDTGPRSQDNRWRGRRDAVQWREFELLEDAEEASKMTGSKNGRRAYVFPSVPGTRICSLYAVHTHPIYGIYGIFRHPG